MIKMKNLLSETKEAIEQSGHFSSQIVFIGSELSGCECSWLEFCKLADESYLNYSHGTAEVATDLIIVFSDGQRLWRGEADGVEWWNFSKPFVRPAKSYPITSLMVNTAEFYPIKNLIRSTWPTLNDLNLEPA